jgi:hypothetical protein
VFIDFSNGHKLVLRLEEISGQARANGEKAQPDRTVIIDPAARPLLAEWILNEQIVRRLGVSCGGRAVTLMFPSAQLQEVSGVNITTEPIRKEGGFLVYWKRDDYFVQIRSLRQGADGSLNIIYENRRYVFSLHDVPRTATPRPPDTITFYRP